LKEGGVFVPLKNTLGGEAKFAPEAGKRGGFSYVGENQLAQPF